MSAPVHLIARDLTFPFALCCGDPTVRVEARGEAFTFSERLVTCPRGETAVPPLNLEVWYDPEPLAAGPCAYCPGVATAAVDGTFVCGTCVGAAITDSAETHAVGHLITVEHFGRSRSRTEVA